MLALASTQRSFSSAASPAPLRGRAKLGEKMEALLSAVPGPDDPEAAAKVERWLLGKRNVVVAVLGLVSGRVSGAFHPALRGAMQPARASVRWEDRVGVLTLPTRGSSNKRK